VHPGQTIGAEVLVAILARRERAREEDLGEADTMGRGTPAPEPRHERLTDRGPNDLLAVNELHSGRYRSLVQVWGLS
jgi:hypothetical protein